MTAERCQDMMAKFGTKWVCESFGGRPSAKPILVHDHERCLWTEDSQYATAHAGFHLLGDFPKSSPDVNAIEGVWKMLRDALLRSAPQALEPRPAFVKRLRRTVAKMNKRQRPSLLNMCTNQKDRAKDIIELKGARCKW